MLLLRYDHYNNQRKKRNSVADKKIATGSVNTQANKIFWMVPACRFLMPLLATIAPAIPDDRECVVLTGTLNADAKPMVKAATNSAEAPCA